MIFVFYMICNSSFVKCILLESGRYKEPYIPTGYRVQDKQDLERPNNIIRLPLSAFCPQFGTYSVKRNI